MEKMIWVGERSAPAWLQAEFPGGRLQTGVDDSHCEHD
jgi:hypothetical protein